MKVSRFVGITTFAPGNPRHQMETMVRSNNNGLFREKRFSLCGLCSNFLGRTPQFQVFGYCSFQSHFPFNVLSFVFDVEYNYRFYHYIETQIKWLVIHSCRNRCPCDAYYCARELSAWSGKLSNPKTSRTRFCEFRFIWRCTLHSRILSVNHCEWFLVLSSLPTLILKWISHTCQWLWFSRAHVGDAGRHSNTLS